MIPTAAARTWPYPHHRTLEQVDRDAAEGCTCELVEEYGDQDDCAFLARCLAGEVE